VQKKLVSYFPQDYSPSKSQIQLINGVEKAFAKGKKFVICCAPTGTGKSFLGKTLANVSSPPTSAYVNLINSYDAFRQDYSGNYTHEADARKEPAFGTFTLTITKSLQDQYVKLFEDGKLLKGKANYQCQVDTNFDVESAPCVLVNKLKEDCWTKNICPYYTARNTALTDKFSILNYKMFLSLPDHVKRKNFIICDEASELEDELVRRFSAFIEYDRLKNYDVSVVPLVTDSTQKVRVWLYDLIFHLGEIINTLQNRQTKKITNLSPIDKIKIRYLKNLYNNLVIIESLWDECEFVVEKDSQRASFTPLKVDKLSKYIFDYGENILLMSATIIDHKNFAKTLGIKDYEYVEVDSTFESSKSPIYVTSKNKLNYKTIKTELPEIVNKIKQICDFHKDAKGVIHTHTMEITEYIKTRLHGERFLFRELASKNEDILKEHSSSSKPTVLVSPSLSFGIDLKDELARFQIIVKLPYLPLSSKRVKKLFELDKNWYIDKMLNAMVQATGRATRSKNDYSVTYILDGNIVDVIKTHKHRLPKYFIDRII
jgi:Rad3-related DNA helicase